MYLLIRDYDIDTIRKAEILTEDEFNNAAEVGLVIDLEDGEDPMLYVDGEWVPVEEA